MQKLGYIISKTKLRNIADFVEVTEDVDKINSEKPAMIVGLETARSIEGFSIINKKFKVDKFWTFGKTEKRTDYENDLDQFYGFIINNLVKKVKYYYVDVSTISREKVKNLLKILSSNEHKYIYISKGMLYLYYGGNILGISLTLLKYCRINVDKHLKNLCKNKNNKIYYNETSISPKLRQYAKDKKYIIPYFYSLAEEN